MKSLAEVKFNYICSVLRHTKGNVSHAAKILGVTRESMYKRSGIRLAAQTIRQEARVKLTGQFNQTLFSSRNKLKGAEISKISEALKGM